MKSLFRWLLALVLISVYGQSAAMTYSQAWRLGRAAIGGDTTARATLQNAAASGDINAVVGLGNYYFGMKRYSNAINYYKRAATEGSAPGEFGLAVAYFGNFILPPMSHLQSKSQLNEIVSSKKFKEVIFLAKKAANSNDKDKRLWIGKSNNLIGFLYRIECYAGSRQSCGLAQHYLLIAIAASEPSSGVFYECPFAPNHSNFTIEYTASNLFTGSPYQTKGKCYSILYSTVIQLVNRHTALLKTFGGYYMASFSRAYAPAVHAVVTGVAKSEGAFKYVNTIGAVSIVPKVIYRKTTYSIINPNTNNGAQAASLAEQAQLVQDAASQQQ